MTKELVTAAVPVTTVNYHLLRPGNMGCGYTMPLSLTFPLKTALPD